MLNNFATMKYYGGSMEYGNEDKLTTMQSGLPGFQLGPAASPPFRALLDGLFDLCKAHYDAKLATWRRVYAPSGTLQPPFGEPVDLLKAIQQQAM